MTVSTRTIECVVALVLFVIPVILLLIIYPAQVPSSPFDDVNARLYPNSLAVIWTLLGIINLAQALRRPPELLEIAPRHIARVTAIFGLVLAGYLILRYVGFVTGAFFYIITFAWMLGERRLAAWVAAVLMPFALYYAMLYGFELRLPSLLNRL